jgi:hypothetical protein
MSIGRILAKRFSGPEVETRIRIETSATGGLDPSSVGIRMGAEIFCHRVVQRGSYTESGL